MTDVFLTFLGAAMLLKVAKITVYTMARMGQLSAFKVRGQWRFKHDDIEQWIDEQKAAVRGHAGKGASDV